MFLASRPKEWDPPFIGIQPLVLKGLLSSVTDTDSFQVRTEHESRVSVSRNNLSLCVCLSFGLSSPSLATLAPSKVPYTHSRSDLFLCLSVCCVCVCLSSWHSFHLFHSPEGSSSSRTTSLLPSMSAVLNIDLS